MSLCASLIVTLEPLAPGAPAVADSGEQARGLFYHLLAETSSQLATAAHDAPGPKPFTCSSLLGRHDRGAGGTLLLSGGPYRLRYTTLREDVTDALSAALYRRSATGEPVEIGGAPFRVRRVVTASGEEPWGRAATYAQMAGAPPRDLWRLRFASPTAFRQRLGHLPLPVPSALLGSALERWNAFCPEGLAIGESEVGEAVACVFPGFAQIRTRVVQLRRGRFTGFVGRVDLTAVRRLPADDLVRLTALVEFLYYCGAGHGVTRGCGHVAVLDSPWAGGR